MPASYRQKRHIPTDAKAVERKDLQAVVYTYFHQGMQAPGLSAFTENNLAPELARTYRTEKLRDQAVETFFEVVQERQGLRQRLAAERRRGRLLLLDNFKVGDILVCTAWDHEPVAAHFYQVTSKWSTFLRIRPIACTVFQADSNLYTDAMPHKGQWTGPEEKHFVQPPAPGLSPPSTRLRRSRRIRAGGPVGMASRP